MDFAVSADHIVKIKEIEKTDKNLNLAREQKTLLNMRVAVISIVLSTLQKVLNQLGKKDWLEIRRIETIQPTAL